MSQKGSLYFAATELIAHRSTQGGPGGDGQGEAETCRTLFRNVA